MGQVNVNINGRSYRLHCGDGDESRLRALADHLSAKVEAITTEHGKMAEPQLLLMAALLTADEAFDLRDRAKSAEEALAALRLESKAARHEPGKPHPSPPSQALATQSAPLLSQGGSASGLNADRPSPTTVASATATGHSMPGKRDEPVKPAAPGRPANGPAAPAQPPADGTRAATTVATNKVATAPDLLPNGKIAAG